MAAQQLTNTHESATGGVAGGPNNPADYPLDMRKVGFVVGTAASILIAFTAATTWLVMRGAKPAHPAAASVSETNSAPQMTSFTAPPLPAAKQPCPADQKEPKAKRQIVAVKKDKKPKSTPASTPRAQIASTGKPKTPPPTPPSGGLTIPSSGEVVGELIAAGKAPVLPKYTPAATSTSSTNADDDWSAIQSQDNNIQPVDPDNPKGACKGNTKAGLWVVYETPADYWLGAYWGYNDWVRYGRDSRGDEHKHHRERCVHHDQEQAKINQAHANQVHLATPSGGKVSAPTAAAHGTFAAHGTTGGFTTVATSHGYINSSAEKHAAAVAAAHAQPRYVLHLGPAHEHAGEAQRAHAAGGGSRSSHSSGGSPAHK